MRTIVVCATQRSGSTMVCEDMERLGLGRPEEHFLPWTLEEDRDWRRALDNLRETASRNGILAVKVMANQMRTIDCRLSAFTAPLSQGPFPFFRSAFRDADWLWVRRRDTVAQAISHFLARRSGVYHVVRRNTGFVPGASRLEGHATAVPEVEYDFEQLLTEWHSIQGQTLFWSELFREASINAKVITYEDYDQGDLMAWARDRGLRVGSPDKDRNLSKMPSQRNEAMRRRFLADLFSLT
ncbi:Stf0 family sulfotransferase [Jannaschia rubra]|uniref:Stf0 sulphotransferase n=1 Tax=Jannaschia rubra TaxID=282197 RepID=A0A0M6XPA5_9RHOB|nr:Stf0 family sulfotransferase [Jannaschia rubra]CTQ32728.1 Stf0 sulphotransferase [Jannaschia rubra]SFF88372.1 LPS sulfotransferase NodH [Jannaschia rubra]